MYVLTCWDRLALSPAWIIGVYSSLEKVMAACESHYEKNKKEDEKIRKIHTDIEEAKRYTPGLIAYSMRNGDLVKDYSYKRFELDQEA